MPAGESGSGKTMNLFQAARYIVKSSKKETVTAMQVDAIKTIIEAFAGAKTLKNNNATRVGYVLELLYRNESIEGVALRHLLPLELTRLVYQKRGERNFNVFYQMCAGLEESLRQKSNSMAYLRILLKVGKLMKTPKRKILFEVIDYVLRLIFVFIAIKNPQISDNEEQMGVEIGNDSEVKWSAYLLEIDPEQWSAIFTCKTTVNGEETISTPLTINQALDVRDALAQLIYDELFHWIMSRISYAYQCPNHNTSIALVDFYGFEMPTSIDNERVIELLFKRPEGLVPLLDDECKFPKDRKTFMLPKYECYTPQSSAKIAFMKPSDGIVTHACENAETV
uniref:Myosin motor domain-containing protein n=1 Tax=Parascaris equorum TaxID=6256 RepID=A0A914S9T8_PAREQ